MRRGRKEKELVAANGPAATFAGALRDARRKAGSPTYRQMGEAVHFSAPALSQAASGSKLPSWPVTAAYLKACGVTELAAWENDWHIAKIETRLIRAKTPQPPRAHPIQRAMPACSPSTSDKAASPRDQLLDILNRLASGKGLSLRAIASQTKTGQVELAALGGPAHTLSSSTIHDVLSGRRPITQDFITIYLQAVGATVEEQRSVGEAIGRLEYKLVTSGVKPLRAIGIVSVPRPPVLPATPKITAEVFDDPMADTFVLPVASAPEPAVIAWRASDVRVRRHRGATGYYGESSAKLSPAALGRFLQRPGVVAAMMVVGGLVCWIIALAMAVVPRIRWSAYDFGTTALVVSGVATITTVITLLGTVLRDDTPSVETGWYRRFSYQGRHCHRPDHPASTSRTRVWSGSVPEVVRLKPSHP